MKDIHRRYLLFVFGCMTSRLMLVYGAHQLDTTHRKYLATALLIPMIGFLYLYVTNSRDTGPETFGAQIWWKDLRIVHALFYAWFVVDAYLEKPNAYVPLLLDVIFGFFSFIVHYSL